jgi:membrane protease YdiL (CAAX protease family)
MNSYELTVNELTDDEVKKGLRRCSDRNSFLVIFFDLAVLLFGYLVLPKIMELFGDNISSSAFETIRKAFMFGWQFLVVIPLVLIIGNMRTKHKVRTYFAKPKASVGFILKWICITLGLTYTVNVLFTIIFAVIQMVSGQELAQISLVAQDSLGDRVVMFVSIAFLAPVFEELFFRGTLLTHTLPYGSWFSIVTIGVTFGLIHENYQQMFYAALMGMIACFLAVKTQSILTTMAVHFSINFIGAVQSMFLSKLDIYSNAEIMNDNKKLIEYISEHSADFIPLAFISMVYLILAVTGVVLFIIEVVKHRETFVLENNCPQVPAGKKAIIYITSPVTIIAIVIVLGLTIFNSMPTDMSSKIQEYISSIL